MIPIQGNITLTTESNSTPVTPPRKPQKPRPDFPLFAHAAGYWAKKVRGKLIYFGRWDDPDGPEKQWLQQGADLLAGRTPHAETDALTLFTLCGKFLATKKRMLEVGDLSIHTYNDYTAVCQRILKAFGKGRLVSEPPTDCRQSTDLRAANGWAL